MDSSDSEDIQRALNIDVLSWLYNELTQKYTTMWQEYIHVLLSLADSC